jgi:hypothetical protein
MQLNTGITHCVDCGRSLTEDKIKLHKVKFNIPRCRDCYRTKVANNCQYFYKDGKQCKSHAICGDCYCVYHLDLPAHLRSKYKPPPSSTPGRQQQSSRSETRQDRSRRNSKPSRSSKPMPDIPDPCIDDLLPESNTRLYRLVGVSSRSSLAEIRAAYLHRARQIHPDRNFGIDTTEQFQDLKSAYDMIIKIHKKIII